MSSVFAGLAAEVVDATFELWGESDPTAYTPPGGGSPIPCTVILAKRDEGAHPADGRPLAGQQTISVRVAEVPSPAAQGSFTVGLQSYTIATPPILVDSGGLVGKMWIE